jgi:hypothetical protein
MLLGKRCSFIPDPKQHYEYARENIVMKEVVVIRVVA